MPLDPQVTALFEVMGRADAPSYEEQTPVEARGRGDAAPTPPAPAVARIEMFEVPGPNGGVPVRVYTPAGSGPFPALVLIHGGGWVVGSIWGYEATARLLANAAECVVVSVEYRLAPEHKFPAAPDDCYAAAKWTYEQADLIGADPSRIAVAGGSAGGNLAAVVALMARDRGGPDFALQVPIYPVIERDFTRPSYVENGQGPGLTQAGMAWFWDHYLADDADADHPLRLPTARRSPRGRRSRAGDHRRVRPSPRRGARLRRRPPRRRCRRHLQRVPRHGARLLRVAHRRRQGQGGRRRSRCRFKGRVRDGVGALPGRSLREPSAG